MKAEKFSEALNQISDSYIMEAVNYRKRKSQKKYSILAAGLAGLWRYADNSISTVVKDSNIPSIYINPNYMVIFTDENEKGWELKNGDKFTINFSLHNGQSLSLEIGYVFEGEYFELSDIYGTNYSETLNITQDGEYYFCITNRSSANAVIEGGSIE